MAVQTINFVFVGANSGSIHFVTTHSENRPAVDRLRELLSHADVDPLDREEGEAALARIEQLAEKGKSPSVAARVKQRLDVVSGVLSVGKELAATAEPHVASILRFFGGS